MSAHNKNRGTSILRHTLLWLLIAAAVGGGIYGMVKIASRPVQNSGAAITVPPLAENDWVKGGRAARTVLIEYSDFQCPACAFYYPYLKRLSEEFGDDLAIIYRHFPLPMHQNAKAAAAAADAAGRQGKFWEMHDAIFDSQRLWEGSKDASEFFATRAQELGLDVEKFKADMGSDEARDAVRAAYQASVRMGLNSTPTLFLNGRLLVNPRSYEDLRNAVTEAINAKP